MSIKIDRDNYFDIAEALHSVLTLWHDGKFGYELLCRSQFRPGMGYRESDVENENEFYHEIESLLLDKNKKFKSYDKIEKLMDKLNKFVDNLED